MVAAALDRKTAVAWQGGQPAHGQVDHQQAHEIGDPQREGAQPIMLAEQLAHGRFRLGVHRVSEKARRGGEVATQLVEGRRNAGGREAFIRHESRRFRQ